MVIDRSKVVLVDENDQAIGVMNKLEAHEKGMLHRAFSVFIFNEKGEMLIHQRARDKYHGSGLWTNACCSHPQWDEDVKGGAQERLFYEMGIACDLSYKFSFSYKIPVENELIEHEFDHVFLGTTNKNPTINLNEVMDYQWINPTELQRDIILSPNKYTFWFKEILPILMQKLAN
ncbi:isopentenyl-diphosphate Delta-isomerase [Pedobacter insulae]|uniref:Isopentenyl-diphosphate delta-isomerase n=1 Tax=Pedobacter insulae TaxID=414048 RepID=A0A1I2UUE8_9SPHI|nr:isopentenyl-diphosphate Delta-isomerase [Pedobacter insulae]SFG80698.1 isopentenyl-diphosphate delta-isomerase [Pedobacter insulae]